MESIYTNILILLILCGIVIWIHYGGSKPEYFAYTQTQSSFDFASIPYIHRPLLNYFSSQPSGYDAGTRSYSNPYFALEVAQGLDTN